MTDRHTPAMELFPYADVIKGWTLSGLLDHSRTDQRQVWGRILAGETQALAKGLAGAFGRDPIGLSDEQALHFFVSEVEEGRFEDNLRIATFGVGPRYDDPIIIRARAFRNGWKARDRS